MRKIVISGIVAAMFASPAFADTAATSDQAVAQPAVVANTNPVECYYIYHEGTAMPRPACKTRNQWNAIRLQQQYQLMRYEAKAAIQHQ